MAKPYAHGKDGVNVRHGHKSNKERGLKGRLQSIALYRPDGRTLPVLKDGAGLVDGDDLAPRGLTASLCCMFQTAGERQRYKQQSLGPTS